MKRRQLHVMAIFGMSLMLIACGHEPPAISAEQNLEFLKHVHLPADDTLIRHKIEQLDALPEKDRQRRCVDAERQERRQIGNHNMPIGNPGELYTNGEFSYDFIACVKRNFVQADSAKLR